MFNPRGDIDHEDDTSTKYAIKFNAGRRPVWCNAALAEASRRYQVFMTLKFDKRIS
jgi:NAD/NADP transhydrogenase beta subunit